MTHSPSRAVLTCICLASYMHCSLTAQSWRSCSLREFPWSSAWFQCPVPRSQWHVSAPCPCCAAWKCAGISSQIFVYQPCSSSESPFWQSLVLGSSRPAVVCPALPHQPDESRGQSLRPNVPRLLLFGVGVLQAQDLVHACGRKMSLKNRLWLVFNCTGR